MSDFTVLRSLDGYCLVLDKKRIAGGKPDYRGENVLVDWTTEVAYGPVDDLAAENAKLREQGERLFDKTLELGTENAKLREQIHWLKKGDILHVLTDQEFAEQQKHEREMQASIKALDDENAKLRGQLEGIVGRSFRTADKMACLADENAKLRELVRDVVLLAPNRGADILCVEWSASDGSWLSIKDRMSELGVEV